MEERAVFAGGCFWCMVEPFESRAGIHSVISGFTGGQLDHPTYDQVCGNYTGHVEAVEIIFDNELVSYADLVELYWQLIDPTDDNGQFYDRGDSYRPVIFVENEAQRQIAQKSKENLAASGRFDQPIIVPIEATGTFWPAEEYHQAFYKKKPNRYKAVHRVREKFAKKYWQKPKRSWFKR